MSRPVTLQTSEQAAEQLGVSVRTVQRMVARGRLRAHVRTRSVFLFTDAEVARAARKREAAA